MHDELYYFCLRATLHHLGDGPLDHCTTRSLAKFEVKEYEGVYPLVDHSVDTRRYPKAVLFVHLHFREILQVQKNSQFSLSSRVMNNSVLVCVFGVQLQVKSLHEGMQSLYFSMMSHKMHEKGTLRWINYKFVHLQ
jgi:hypothetical protein